jgi:glycosyltransferase involved in cell wall biosynthesis
VNVCVVAEYYPRRRDPVLGAWAHRQAVAARDAGADVRVLVLDRPLPSAAALRDGPRAAARELRAALAQPRRDTLDGIEVEYVRFVAPPRERSYASWHLWAARPLRRALDRLHDERRLDLVHAHYALPAGGAARRWTALSGVPLAVSVHGGDLLSPLLGAGAGRTPVTDVLGLAKVVIANSGGMRERAAELVGSDERIRVIHPPGEPPPRPLSQKRARPTIATVANLDPRKRHADVLEALARLREDVHWLVIGDGPERDTLDARARELGLAARVELAGALPPSEAVAKLATCHVMAMPSVDEAFGVAYTEALACGVPAIACRGEPGPEEIASLSPSITLVPPRDPAALARAIQTAIAKGAEPDDRFSLAECGRQTMDAYEEATR